MFDLEEEPPITVIEAAAIARVTFPTVLDWIRRGAKDPTGEVVHLEGFRLGGKWVTSKAALARFAKRLTPEPEVFHAS